MEERITQVNMKMEIHIVYSDTSDQELLHV